MRKKTHMTCLEGRGVGVYWPDWQKIKYPDLFKFEKLCHEFTTRSGGVLLMLKLP
jgi:hypothetical protein